MLSLPFLLEVGLIILAMAVVVFIGFLRPHRADVKPYPKEKWVIPPTLFRYAFWFGVLATLIMALFVVVEIYYRPLINA